MGQILHKCATTTEAVRRAIQDSQESLSITFKTLWDQREDGSQVEEKDFDGRSSHWTEEATFHGSVD